MDLLHAQTKLLSAVTQVVRSNKVQIADCKTMDLITLVGAARQPMCLRDHAFSHACSLFCRPNPVQLALSFVRIGVT